MLVQRRRLGAALQLQIMLLGGRVVGGSVDAGGGAARQWLILAALVLTGMVRVMMMGGVGVRVRRAPGVALLPRGVRAGRHPLGSFVVSHSSVPVAGVHFWTRRCASPRFAGTESIFCCRGCETVFARPRARKVLLKSESTPCLVAAGLSVNLSRQLR